MTSTELKYELLNLLGLTVYNGRIYDIDKCQYLLFNGKFIYMQNENTTIFHKNDIRFDPLNNIKLASYLLTIFTQKEAEDTGLYVKCISIGELQTRDTKFIKRNIQAQVQFNLEGKIITENIFSNYYYNLCLGYIDMIYRISCTPLPVLTQFDYTDKDIIEMQNKRKKK